MAIRVRFDKHGWYHPAFGRLGRGRTEGKIYVLPEMFAERETITVPIMDQKSMPPTQIGEKEVTRYKHLPQSVEILDADEIDAEIAEAKAMGDTPPEVIRPITSELIDVEQLPGQRKVPPAQTAKERTTGTRRRKVAS